MKYAKILTVGDPLLTNLFNGGYIIEEEAKSLIMERLWEHYRHTFVRASKNGLPEWYKEKLLQKQVAQ